MERAPPPRESKLVQATRHVTEGRLIVARQRETVARLRASGIESPIAEQLLDQFERTLAIFEADLQSIRAKEKENAK